jgi:hypothetical protein
MLSLGAAMFRGVIFGLLFVIVYGLGGTKNYMLKGMFDLVDKCHKL